MVDPATKDFAKIREAGEEFADQLLTSAVTSSKTEKQMTDQILILEMMSTKILASMIVNAKLQLDRDPEAFLQVFISEIRAEIKYQFEADERGELEKVLADVKDFDA